MTSTVGQTQSMHQPYNDLDYNRAKRRHPNSQSEKDFSEEDEDYDEENDDGQENNNSNNYNSQTSPRNQDQDHAQEPPKKERKKPGRKPNPASPAIRKEQNRAAQRAFRDRKERHLQQLENMIKDLKDSHHQVTSRFQREAHQMKSVIDSLQSENYYLREVVFSFESALGKNGNANILQSVKAELYRRHYDNHAARKMQQQGSAEPPSPAPQAHPSPVNPNIILPNKTPSVASQPAPISPHPSNSSTYSSASSPMAPNAMWQSMATDPQDDNIFSVNSEILYKAPPLFTSGMSDDGKPTTPLQPFEAIAVPKLPYSPPGTCLPKHTDYTKHLSVYDELQSSLFPPGTLQSLVHSDMATPQEVVNDISLFDTLQDAAASLPNMFTSSPPANQNMFSFGPLGMDHTMPHQPTYLETEDIDSNEFRMTTPNLGFDEGFKQDSMSTHRLSMEIRILASAPAAADPNIDPKVYELPHDSRIDLIPCPKLRAQMILHQSEYNIEDLCQLLMGEAICHGHPLDPHSWELPKVFFERYGFLMGQELMRYKNKIWPKKTREQQDALRREMAKSL